MANVEHQNPSGLRAFLSTITIEPVLFLNTLAWSLQGHTIQTLSLYKICHVTLHYPSDVCRRSLNNKTIEKEIEVIENDLSVYRTYIEFIPSLILALILGAWGDSYGRKMPMLISKFGYLVAAFVILTISLIDEWPPETIFAFSALIGITGGGRVFDTAAICYIADISSPEWRTSRFGFVKAARFISFPVGSVLSGYLQTRWDFWPIFALAAFVRVISFTYLAWRIHVIIPARARINQPQEQITLKHRLLDMFRWKTLKNYFTVLFKHRPGHYRLWLLLVITANWFQSIPAYGESHIDQLFYRYKFSWGQDMFSYYSSFGTLFACIGLLICLPLLCNKLKLSDPLVELIGNVSTIINPVIIAFSTKHWMPWAALSLTTFYAFVYPSMKSFTSKIIDPDEYGKVFTLKDTSEIFITFFAGILYTRVYDKTLDTFPGAVFLLSAAFCSISAIIFFIILVDFKRTSAYTVVVESANDN